MKGLEQLESNVMANVGINTLINKVSSIRDTQLWCKVLGKDCSKAYELGQN